MTQKEKILNACRNGGNSIPNENLLNYINSEVVSFDELKNAGLSDEKAEYITQALESEETNLWNEATSNNTLDAYMDYIDRSKLGRHIGVAQTKIDEFDDAKWNEAQSQLSSNTLSEKTQSRPTINTCSNTPANMMQRHKWQYYLFKTTILGTMLAQLIHQAHIGYI